MYRLHFLRSFWVVLLTIWTFVSWGQDSLLNTQPLPLADTPKLSKYRLELLDGKPAFIADKQEGLAVLSINGGDSLLYFEQGRAVWEPAVGGAGQLYLLENKQRELQMVHLSTRADGSWRLKPIRLWWSVLPPLVAIGLALVFREVLLSLFVGVWVGAFIAAGLRIDSLYYLMISVFDVLTNYVLRALNDSGHLSIIIFSLLIGGMVAIISRNGGMTGVVNYLSRYARSEKSAQFVTWFLGVAIFFDDYANTLIVGNTMRPVTDRFKISREKLAYLVDSTAAPVAAVAFITTWIGAELGYIDDGIKLLTDFPADLTPYGIFIESLKYAFYPAFTLIFMLIIIYSGREFGPMLAAERSARAKGVGNQGQEDNPDQGEVEDLSPVPNIRIRAYNAIVPVALVIGMTIFGLLDTGLDAVYQSLLEIDKAPAYYSWGTIWAAMGSLWEGEKASFVLKLGKVIGAADSYMALLYASLSGVIAAVVLTLAGGIMQLERTMSTLVMGIKTMIPALMILTLAWSLALTTEELHTAKFLTYALKDSINPYVLPPIVFVLAAMISFSTGSSWSTMAILYPIAIPITWAVSQANGIDSVHAFELLFNVIATVLGASVLGDHCSPISDTTILSSLASGCNHIEHVRTQLPYALVVGVLSLLSGMAATLMGGGWMVCLPLLIVSTLLLWLLVRWIGKPIASEQ
jgi:Na+/H+ antiporter NhaC